MGADRQMPAPSILKSLLHPRQPRNEHRRVETSRSLDSIRIVTHLKQMVSQPDFMDNVSGDFFGSICLDCVLKSKHTVKFVDHPTRVGNGLCLDAGFVF